MRIFRHRKYWTKMLRSNHGSDKIVILNCLEIVLVMTCYDLIPFDLLET